MVKSLLHILRSTIVCTANIWIAQQPSLCPTNYFRARNIFSKNKLFVLFFSLHFVFRHQYILSNLSCIRSKKIAYRKPSLFWTKSWQFWHRTKPLVVNILYSLGWGINCIHRYNLHLSIQYIHLKTMWRQEKQVVVAVEEEENETTKYLLWCIVFQRKTLRHLVGQSLINKTAFSISWKSSSGAKLAYSDKFRSAPGFLFIPFKCHQFCQCGARLTFQFRKTSISKSLWLSQSNWIRSEKIKSNKTLISHSDLVAKGKFLTLSVHS